MFVANIFYFALAIISVAYFLIRKKFSYFEENGFLYEKPSFPFGNLKGVGTNTHIVYRLREYYEKFKGKAPAFGIFFSIAPDVVITDLDVIKDVLMKSFDTFHNRGIYYNLRDDPLTGHLIALEDNDWRTMRAKLTPTFTSGKMKVMFKTLVDVSELMIKQLDKDPNLNMTEMREKLGKYTTDVIGNVAFGLELNSIADPESQFRKMGKKIFRQDKNVQIKIFLLTSFRSIARKLKMKFLPSDVSEFFTKVIRETVDYRLENEVERNDVLDILMKISNTKSHEEGKLSFNELAAQCFLFWIAGFETSSSTATFALYALSLNQEVQNKLRDEIKTVLKKYNDELTYEAMQEMRYLHMVVDETLRLYAPAPQLIRKASQDYLIPNTSLKIRKDMLVIVPINSIHMDPEYYPEPEIFDPERFTEEKKQARHPMAYMPFGEGPRACIGLRFGLMQTKIALIQLLRNFQFHPSPRTVVPLRFDPKSLILAPENDMWLKVERL